MCSTGLVLANDEAALLERSAAHPMHSEKGMKHVSVSLASGNVTQITNRSNKPSAELVKVVLVRKVMVLRFLY